MNIQTVKFYTITFIIQSLIFSSVCSDNCPKTTPIKKDGNCQLINCEDSDYETGTCIIANDISKIQWLNNIIKISDLYYNLANVIINLNGDLFIQCIPTKKTNTNDEIYKERVFYGLRKNGRPLFYDQEKNTYVSMKKLYLNTAVYKSESEIINLKIGENSNYYFSSDRDDGYSEIYDFNDNITYYTPLTSFLDNKYIKLNRYVLMSNEKRDQLIFGYIGNEKNSNDLYLFLHKIKFNSPDFSNGSYNQTLLEKTKISNEVNMISCLETELKYIECFIVNDNKEYSVNIYNNSYEDDYFNKLGSIIIDNSQVIQNLEVFYKGIHLKKEISAFIYFFITKATLFTYK